LISDITPVQPLFAKDDAGAAMAVMSGELNNLKTALNPLKTALNTSRVEGSRGFQDAFYFFHLSEL
jgi:hypothetical protein